MCSVVCLSQEDFLDFCLIHFKDQQDAPMDSSHLDYTTGRPISILWIQTHASRHTHTHSPMLTSVLQLCRIIYYNTCGSFSKHTHSDCHKSFVQLHEAWCGPQGVGGWSPGALFTWNLRFTYTYSPSSVTDNSSVHNNSVRWGGGW